MAGAQKPLLTSTPKGLLRVFGGGSFSFLMTKLQTERRKKENPKTGSACVCRYWSTFFSLFLRTTCRLPLRFPTLLCLQWEGIEINPMTPRQPAQMTGQMWGYGTAYRPVFSPGSVGTARYKEIPGHVKHAELAQKGALGCGKAGSYRCATCPRTGTCEIGSTGTCCGSSSGFCSCFRTCRTPA